MKRILSIILACVLGFSVNVSAYAEESNESSLSIRDMFEAAVSSAQARGMSSPLSVDTVLTNENGDVYSVNMYEYIPDSTSNDDSYTKTFVYSTQAEYVTPRATNTQTNAGWDNSISVYGYITITYHEREYFTNNGVSEYLLTKVEGGWEKSDPRVTMSNRYVSYTCQYLFDASQVNWEYPTTNTFSYDTGYDTYIIEDGNSAVLGAVSIVDLAHGSSSEWELMTRAYLIENDYGDIIMSLGRSE